jgi:hypothetical protein
MVMLRYVYASKYGRIKKHLFQEFRGWESTNLCRPHCECLAARSEKKWSCNVLFQRLLNVVCAGLSEKYRTNSQVHWLNIKFRIPATFVPYHTNPLVQLQINVLFCGQDVPRCAKNQGNVVNQGKTVLDVV